MCKIGSAGIILCAKPSEADEVCALLQKAGRGDSIIRLNGRNGGFNFLAYALARLGADAISSIVEYLLRVVEIVRNASPLPAGNGDAFWLDELRRTLSHLLLPIYWATGTLRMADIIACVRSAATSLEQMRDPEWQRQSFFFQIFAAAADRMGEATGQQLMAYWREFAQMDGKLRGSVLASFNMLDRFNHGILREGLCGKTDVVPALCFHGVIFVLDTPRAIHGEDGVIFQMVWKDAFQTEVLGRNALEPIHRDRFLFCYADEFQEFITSRDSEFLAQSRSSRCTTIALTQSLPSLYAKLGPNSHDRVHALIANMAVRFYGANGCNVTNGWASQAIGKVVQRRSNFSASEGRNTSYGLNMGEGRNHGTQGNWGGNSGYSSSSGGGSTSGGNSWGGGWSDGDNHNWGRSRGGGSNHGTSNGWSETLEDAVEPGFFARGLKVGGPAHGFRVSTILHQPARRFAATGTNYTLIEWSQL
ncbi:TraM recognition domain-containing protein [Sphingobium sp. AN641]|uniref:TraM recognition domain-containing protein n=1 Tax=Sphingobium sp. AN641 TaxID=3133443 RepID=UPI0030C10631